MSVAEISLLESFLRCSENYVEFGAGGSTFVACSLVRQTVTAVDSSLEWLQKVEEECKRNNLRIAPDLLHVNIGEIKEWGYPTDDTSKDLWPDYHSRIWWQKRSAQYADLYMVDGRFRVACFAQILLHCQSDALVMVHDFSSRKNYHVIRQVAREIAAAEDLSVFQPMKGADRDSVKRILLDHINIPN